MKSLIFTPFLVSRIGSAEKDTISYSATGPALGECTKGPIIPMVVSFLIISKPKKKKNFNFNIFNIVESDNLGL